MLERLFRFIGIFFVFLIFAVPAMVPEIAIAIAIIGWPIVYAVMWLFSLGHSLTADLPWAVLEPGSIALGGILFAAFIGIFFGFNGAVAMVISWAPAFLLPGYMLMLGVAVEHDGGWGKYVYDKYQDPGCDLSYSATCHYRPIAGEQLPSFVTPRYKENILQVIPY